MAIALRASALLPVGAVCFLVAGGYSGDSRDPQHDDGSLSPAKVFAASCATCHGADGVGGHPSWVTPGRYAPRVARGLTSRNMMLEDRFRLTIRNGSYYNGGFRHAMPAFGESVLADADLEALILWLLYAPPLGGSNPLTGVPPPERPSGREILVEVLDEAPWFQDDATDARDPFNDRRRVVLSPGDYIKVVNRGKTWHTVTNRQAGVDTGFIGFSGNIPGQETGYFYLEVADLASGAWKYFCSLHPYMQVEVVTPESEPMPLSHASKRPLPLPAEPGVGEVWVGLQTFNNPGGPNGAIQVIDATDWSSALIPNVGNNPHNGWIGTALDETNTLRNVSVWANWHDVTVTVLDADSRQVLGSVPVGAANAHVMTAPSAAQGSGPDRWFVTVMGSNKVQELDPIRMLSMPEPPVPAISQSDGIVGKPAFSPHGLWFLDDGEHFVAADTLAGTASLYALSDQWSGPMGRSGTGCEVAQAGTGGALPLAASIFNMGNPTDTTFVAYTNNAGTDDISVYSVDATPGAKSLSRTTVGAPLGNPAGNLALTDLSLSPVRWAHMPIQCAVSPPDASSHGRYMVVCNKASFNVSIVALNASGSPTAVYTFPAGLGAHGVAFGRKETGKAADTVGYYAYVTNTFENYVSVYDLQLLERLVRLERIGKAPASFRPGGASEKVYVEGYAAQALLGSPRGHVPITLFSPDARGLVHVGDLPLTRPKEPSPRAYLKEHVYVDLPGMGPTMLDLDLGVETGAMGLFCTPLPPPWSP